MNNNYRQSGNTAAIMKQNQQNKMEKKVSYTVGNSTVDLSINTVRDYLVTGDKERVTMQEIVMFINLCKFSGLNPWLREAYCIKYGNEPATMVVGKEAFEKRADSNPDYNGSESGIITYSPETGVIEHRTGSFCAPGEEIIGGWAEVYRKGREHSTRVEVSFDEYAGRKRDGSLNSQWSKKPGTMIRKVARVQALREAFPNSFAGMYDAVEMGVDDSILSTVPVEEVPVAEQPRIIEQPQTIPEAPAEEEQISLDDV